MSAVDSRTELGQVLYAVAGSGASGLAAIEVQMRRGEMTPLHVHEHDEGVRVLEGSVLLYVGDWRIRLAAGETYVAPGGVPHVVAAGPAGARYLTTSVTPAPGRYQDFVRAVALPALAADGAPEEERALALTAEANGIRVLGPPGRLPEVYAVAA